MFVAVYAPSGESHMNENPTLSPAGAPVKRTVALEPSAETEKPVVRCPETAITLSVSPSQARPRDHWRDPGPAEGAGETEASMGET